MKRFAHFIILTGFAGFLLTGCNLPSHIKPNATNPANPMKRIAVLPIQNDTSDIDAPDFVRKKLIEALQKKQYYVKPVETIDQLLRDRLGATLGGQLKDVNPRKLKNILGVDGVVMGTLMDFDETTTGVYNVRKVRGRFKMFNCDTEEIFWKNGIGIKSLESTGDIAGTATSFAAELKDSGDKDVPWVTMENATSGYGAVENFVLGVGKKLFSKATNSYLEEETMEMIRRITADLPVGPGLSASDSAAKPMKTSSLPYFSSEQNRCTI